MRKTKNINIESQNYELIEMPATRRSIIALQLKHISTGAKEGVKDFDSDLDFSAIIAGILDRIEPEKGAYLLRDIVMNGTQFPVINDVQTYDEYFGEFYDHQIDLVVEIMKFNFGKSIDNIKKKLEKTGVLALISSKVEENQPDSQKPTN